jgi:hypothetical protein
MDNNQSDYNNHAINNDITTNSIVNEGININSDESVKQVPKSFYNSLLNHYYFNKKMMQEMKNTFSKKYIDMKDECEKLKIELKKYNMMKETDEKSNDNISITSVFKKKDKIKSDDNVLSQLEVKKSDKNIISQKGGNNSDKKVLLNKSEEKQKNKKQVTVKSESSENSENDSNNTSSYDSSRDETNDSESSSYEDTSDIYRATETEDGMNKAYSKINREMELISKSQKGGKMTGKEVVKRINFLLNGLKILDSVKKSSKRKK